MKFLMRKYNEETKHDVRTNSTSKFLLVFCLFYLLFVISLINHLPLPNQHSSSTNGGSTADITENTLEKTILPPISAQNSGSLELNLSYYEVDDYVQRSIVIQKGLVINFTIDNFGSGVYDVCLASLESTMTYKSDETTSTLTDDFMVGSAVPWGGNFNDWDNIDSNDAVSSEIKKGLSVSSGTSRSILA